MEIQQMRLRLAAYYAQKFCFDCTDSIRRIRQERVNEVIRLSLGSYVHTRHGDADQMRSNNPTADALQSSMMTFTVAHVASTWVVHQQPQQQQRVPR
jgi:hypothetical protein